MYRLNDPENAPFRVKDPHGRYHFSDKEKNCLVLKGSLRGITQCALRANSQTQTHPVKTMRLSLITEVENSLAKHLIPAYDNMVR